MDTSIQVVPQAIQRFSTVSSFFSTLYKLRLGFFEYPHSAAFWAACEGFLVSFSEGMKSLFGVITYM